MLENRIFNSRVNPDKITFKEQLVGFFISPAGMGALNALLASYLNLYYTDVLKLTLVWNGAYLVLLPILSKLLSILFNILFGKVIDKTKGKNGKARPWILISAPLILVSGILLAVLPSWDLNWQLAWIFITYNCYFSLAANMYGMAHSLIVPLATRDVKKRNRLSIISSIGSTFGNGVFAVGIFAMLILPLLRVDPSKWLLALSCYSVAAFVLVITEYYFTYERNGGETVERKIKIKEQMKMLFSDHYWVLIASLTAVFAFGTEVRNISVMYYCEWTLGTYEHATEYYALIQLIGGFPLWAGAVVIDPLVRKFGKRMLIVIGMLIAAFGDFLEFGLMRNVYGVVCGAVIRNIGLVPILYALSSLFADTLDHAGAKNGRRSDGAAIGADNVIRTISAGLGTGFVNLMLFIYGYQAPDASLTVQNPQNEGMQLAFAILFALVPGICAVVMSVIAFFLDVEKHMPNQAKPLEEKTEN
ncbi:MAG: MFS transporter [Bacilli bacterium]|jgi:GPH family glycoside/pentoside/hexuronide:cation symporter|nr:MFS transporter [Bacilli bacterium]